MFWMRQSSGFSKSNFYSTGTLERPSPKCKDVTRIPTNDKELHSLLQVQEDRQIIIRTLASPCYTSQ